MQPQSWPFSLLICNCRILIIQCSKNLHKLIDCFALVSCKSTSGLVSHYYQTSCIQNHKCISAQVSEKPTDATLQCCASCTVHHDIILARSSRRVSEANMDYKTLHTPNQKAIRKRRKWHAETSMAITITFTTQFMRCNAFPWNKQISVKHRGRQRILGCLRYEQVFLTLWYKQRCWDRSLIGIKW